MFVELHIIQNFAPSCLNRDDTNTPKDCTFGGVRRARISSQCLKRAVRTSTVFQEASGDRRAVRTKLLMKEIVDRVLASDPARDAEQAADVVAAALGEAGYKMDGERTAVLLFLSPGEIDHYATVIEGAYDELRDKLAAKTSKKGWKLDAGADLKKALKGLGSTTEAADIGLFGRMVAENTNMNIEAACQVAHAISTHQAAVEMDFFTAVDDLQPGAETGAGMMGVVEFNSACFYRYSCVDVGQLTENLAGDADSARDAALAYCKAAVVAVPKARQASMAAHNPPSLVFVRVRDGGSPWALSNAFVDPVRVGRQVTDLARSSIERLRQYDQGLAAMYGTEGVRYEGASSTYTDLGDGPLVDIWTGVAGALA